MSKMARPTEAAATLLTPRLAPPIHRPTVIRNASAVIFSSLRARRGGGGASARGAL
jgi:hypothetical protein